MLANRAGLHRSLSGLDPFANHIEIRRGPLAVEFREDIGAVLGVMRPTDHAFLVDPDHRRNVGDVVELRDDVTCVDDTGVRRTGPFDKRPDVFSAPIQSDRERDKTLIAELLVKCLPDRQVLTASSPGRVGDQKYFFTPVLRQAVKIPVQVGQREIRRLQ